MDLYGNPIQGENLSDGGLITGNLEIDGDLDVVNLNVSDTATISTLITEQELKVVDPIILMGKDNPADNVNLGILEEYTDVTKKYSGLLRDRITKQQYLLEGATPEPGTTTDLTLLPKGHLNTGSLTNSNYTLPNTDGTPGQVIATDGLGNLSFADDTGGTLQTAYDLSSDPQITTTIANDTMVVKQGVGIPATILEIQNELGTSVVEMKDDLTLFNQRFVRHQPIVGPAFSYITGVPGETSRLIIGDADPSLGSLSSLSISANLASLKIRAEQMGDLTFDNGSDVFMLKQLGTAPDVLTLEKNGSKRVDFEPTETKFGPDGKILLRDSGQLVCGNFLVLPSTGDGIVVIEAEAGANASLKVGDLDVNDARMDLQSLNRSFIALESEGRNLIKFNPLNSLTSKLWCVEHIIADNNIVWAYDPFGGGARREPLKIESELVTASKLSINGAYTLPDVDGTTGQYLATDGSGVVSWQSLPESSYGEQGFTANGTPSPMTVINQWEEILGSRVAGSLKDFTSQATTLTYTGVDTKTFKYSFQCTAELSTGASEVFEIGIFKNGVLAGGIMNFSMDDNNPFPRSTSTSIVIDLATNDNITTKIRATTNVPEGVDVINMVSNCISVTSGEGGGGGVSGTLQDAYNLSSSPEFVTDAGQGLTIKSGGIAGLEQVLKVEDDLGNVTFRVDANGLTVCNGLQDIGIGNFRGGLSVGSIPANFEYSFPQDNQTASDGDLLKYDLGSRSLQFSTPFAYARTTPRVISNNALELELTDTVDPRLVIPGNTLAVGNSYRITSTGTFRNNGILDNMTFRVRMGGLGPIVSQILFGAVAIGSPQYFKLEVLLTARTVGGSASFAQTISFFVNGQTIGSSSAPVSTFNSLVDVPFAVSAQWSNIGVNNILTQQQLSIEKIA